MTTENCYIVMMEDRHTDIDAEVFEDKDEAITWAMKWVRNNYKEYVESETHYVYLGDPDGDHPLDLDTFYWCSTSTEGDSVHVSVVDYHSKGSKC